jgi:hypothetical protein
LCLIITRDKYAIKDLKHNNIISFLSGLIMQSFGKSEQTTKHDNCGNVQEEEDFQPKDLSFKSNKRMKPIPPPLNLGTANSALKEFAIIATSPKSPLMQKNLPFRKR